MPAQPSAPDLILCGGRTTTLDRSQPQANAVAIKDGRFVAVGRDEDVRALAEGETRVIDLQGRRVLPGLIDNHLHIIRGGLNFKMEMRREGGRRLSDGRGGAKEQVGVEPPRAR